MNASKFVEAEAMARAGLSLLGDAAEDRTLRGIFSGIVSNSLTIRGSSAEAEAVMLPVVQEIRMRGSSRPRDLADALDNLANTVVAPDRAAERVALNREAYELVEAIYGVGHSAVATKMANYGHSMYRAGDVEAAIRITERVLAIRRAHVPAMHPSLANTLGNLGTFAFEAGQMPRRSRGSRRRSRFYAARRHALAAGGRFLYWRATLRFAQGELAQARQQLASSQEILPRPFRRRIRAWRAA